MESINDQYTQIENAISEIDGVVTRIDERLDIFIEKLNSLEKKIDNHIENCPVKCAFPDLIGRIKVIESKNGNALKQEIKEQLKEHADTTKLQIAEIKADITAMLKDMGTMKLEAKESSILSTNTANKWKAIVTFSLQVLAPLVYIIIGAMIFRYFGLTAPGINP